MKAVMGSTQKTAESERKRKQKELSAARARDDELDDLFERISPTQKHCPPQR